ncbi:restriction endonuclease subunit S [Novosphingobium sp.]|uniref:restriction endonuclease subunit S n=1 Tax=Novosphingobium sp. TaxID=1874826 RepID=UPI002734E7BE|nr:restriction endonuclease subunit S [Novosphingobium sp.]MDP3908353.1 restriction endonuclease subunit S [Novosphingobium sp.]
MTPEGWTETRFGNAFAKRAERGKAGLPTMSVTINDGLVFRDSIDRKMDTNLLAEEHLLVRKGDIAYNMMRMWQGASGLAEADALVSPAYVVLRPTAAIDPLFAAYLFKHPRTIYLFWAYSHGLTEDRLRLYFDDFSLIPICLPPISEQRKIAEILSVWDRSIETVEALVQNARNQKQALMQSLLTGKKRLPGFSGEWKTIRLRDIGRCYNGVTYSPDDIVDESGLLVLRSSNVQRGRLAFLDNVYVNPLIKFSCLTMEGDILICVRNGSRNLIGKTARIGTDAVGYAHGAFMSLFRSTDPEFAYHLFQSDTYEQQVKLNLGATINSINTSDLHKFKFLLPPKAERDRIAALLNDADGELKILETQLAHLHQEKSALMQQLLTGKRRVKIGGDFA